MSTAAAAAPETDDELSQEEPELIESSEEDDTVHTGVGPLGIAAAPVLEGDLSEGESTIPDSEDAIEVLYPRTVADDSSGGVAAGAENDDSDGSEASEASAFRPIKGFRRQNPNTKQNTLRRSLMHLYFPLSALTTQTWTPALLNLAVPAVSTMP